MSDKEAFEKALEANPLDWDTRLIYSDWLEENGQDDEAQRQRAWRASWEWMVKLAEDSGETCDNYSYDSPEDIWRSVTVNELIEAGTKFADTLTEVYGPDYFTQMGSERLRNLFGREEGDINPLTYWQHWSVIVGRPIPTEWEYGRPEAPFSCSC